MTSGSEILKQDVNRYWETAPKPPLYCAADYLGMLINKALETRTNGNYGIAAAFVLRLQGHELIFFGANELITANNPHGHAEMDAVQQARKLFNCHKQAKANAVSEELSQAGRLLVRPAPHKETETIVVTTLEPCPMCTIGSVVNTKINEVVIGAGDADSGQMLDGRLQALSKIWADMAKNQNLIITVCQNDDPGKPGNYVSPEMQNLLNRLFFEHREPMDNVLATEGFFRFDPIIVALAAQHLLNQTN